ncbi:hypothetical protein YC2023_066214 [Brassica napus]
MVETRTLFVFHKSKNFTSDYEILMPPTVLTLSPKSGLVIACEGWWILKLCSIIGWPIMFLFPLLEARSWQEAKSNLVTVALGRGVKFVTLTGLSLARHVALPDHGVGLDGQSCSCLIVGWPVGLSSPTLGGQLPFHILERMGGRRFVTTRQTCPWPEGLGRNLRSKTRWFTGFCNSHQVSHFATFFIDARAEISVAESRFIVYIAALLLNKHSLRDSESRLFTCIFLDTFRAGVFLFPGYDNDPSAGSPTETLLRLLLPLTDKV